LFGYLRLSPFHLFVDCLNVLMKIQERQKVKSLGDKSRLEEKGGRFIYCEIPFLRENGDWSGNRSSGDN